MVRGYSRDLVVSAQSVLESRLEFFAKQTILVPNPLEARLSGDSLAGPSPVLKTPLLSRKRTPDFTSGGFCLLLASVGTPSSPRMMDRNVVTLNRSGVLMASTLTHREMKFLECPLPVLNLPTFHVHSY